MKDWIDDHYGERLGYDQLRSAVKAAWEAVPESHLNDLIDQLPARCEAVISADGLQTRY